MNTVTSTKKPAKSTHASVKRSGRLPPVGYSEDTSARIYAYLASVRPLRGVADLGQREDFQRGRALIERMAMSAQGMDPPRLYLGRSYCADVLRFISQTEPLEPRDWWNDPEGSPSHVVGFNFVLQTLADSLDKGER
jgi:hypothetical protein